MRMRKQILFIFFFTFFIAGSVCAQEKKDSLEIKYPDEYLDTVNIKKVFKLNNYSMIGVEYGVSLNIGRFNPIYNHDYMIQPVFAGVTFTRYQKNYSGSPHFGYGLGLFYGKQGYSLKNNSGLLIENANKIVVDYLQMPLWMVLHFDAPHVKALVNLGPYAGYRLKIERSNTFDSEAVVTYPDSFAPADSRVDYGINGGVGVGFVVDPIELHIYLRTSFSFSTFFNPEAYIPPTSKSMLYIHPWDVSLTAALQFQTSRRSGMTNRELRREARRRVNEAAEKKKNE